MARTIATIKASITTDFMSNETLAAAYGFTVGVSFDSVFSKVSIESILFYIVSVAIWTLETLFDTHKTEVTALIDEMKPHSRKWYSEKTLAFMYGYSLIEDSDEYDTTDLDDTTITAAQVVKYAKTLEYSGRLYIKVAGAGPAKLTDAQQTALEAYLAEVKDAGVQIGDTAGSVTVTNLDADHFGLAMTVYYDPMVFNSNGIRLADGVDAIRNTIKDFIQTQIPFNGEYQNVLLTDALQAVDGVKIPELATSKAIPAADYNEATTAGTTPAWTEIQAKYLPAAGYMKVYDDADLNLTFVAYQTIESE